MYNRAGLRETATLFSGSYTPRKKGGPDVARDFRDFDRIDRERQGHKGKWDEVFNLAMPDRQAFNLGKFPGQQPQKAVDSHAIYAARRGAGNIIGALMPEEHKWADIVSGSEVPEEQADDVNAELEKIRDNLFEKVGRSSFYSEAHSMSLDLMCSLGPMIVERGTFADPLRCKAAPMSEVYPIAGVGGDIVGVMRKYECEVGLIEEEWAGYASRVTLPRELEEKKEKDPAEKVMLLEVCRGMVGQGQRITLYAFDSKKVLFDYTGSDPDEPSRWIVARLYRTSDEVYGRGPLLEALPSIRMLNVIQEIEAKGMRKRLDGPIFLNSESGLNPSNIHTTPGAVNVFDGLAMNGNAPFFTPPTDYRGADYGQVKAAEYRDQIDRILFARSVLPAVEDSHQMTAAEVMVRRQELLRDQGVDFGRIQREFLFGFIARALWVLQSFGPAMGVPPWVKIDNKRFKIRYAGPMAQAQKSADATNILAFVKNVVDTIGMEAATLGIRMDEVPHEVAERSGIPASLLRKPEERVKMVQQAAELAQAQAAQMAAPAPQAPAA